MKDSTSVRRGGSRKCARCGHGMRSDRIADICIVCIRTCACGSAKGPKSARCQTCRLGHVRARAEDGAIILQCAGCGSPFRTIPCLAARARFCSKACVWLGRERDRTPQTCEFCGGQYVERLGRNDRTRFCSRHCQNRFLAAESTARSRVVVSCSVCGTVFETKKSKARTTCSPACTRIRQGLSSKGKTTRVECICQCCGQSFETFPCRKGLFCSRVCAWTVCGKARQGKRRNALTTNCAQCGAEVTKPRCRVERAPQVFCNNACYHAWDKQHKGSPEQQERMRERFFRMAEDGTLYVQSSIEDDVSTWLGAQGLKYDQQVRLRYWLIDFQVGETFVEVNGCYWHGCSCLGRPLTKDQQARRARDARVAGHCANRGIPFIVIWEHDIRRGDLSALDALLPAPRD